LTEKTEEMKYENNIKNTDNKTILFEFTLSIILEGSKIIFRLINKSKIQERKCSKNSLGNW